jgi:glycosyltransferase involved in cell wall biosynthesis
MAVVDRVVVTTENRASDLEWMRRLTRQDKIDIVPVGPNVLPVQRKKTDGPFRLGTFSQLSTSKRIDSAIEAFALVAAEVPFSELVLIGDMSGEGLLARRLDVLTRDSPYASRLKKTGRLSLAQIGEHMSQLDVFLFPMVQGMTTRSGTLPVALGSGVPVVGMKGVETSPWFVPDENYVDSGTLKPSQIAAAALRLKREPELGLRVASGGRALFAQHLTWTEIAKALVSGLPSNEKQKELLHEAI